MQFKAQVISNVELSPGYYRMRMTAPPAILDARPGQFVMVRVNGAIDPLLRRPFGIYDLGTFDTPYTDCGRQTFQEILYKVVGKGTGMLADLHQGDHLEILAPLGKGLQFDVGKFVTPHGAEVIETKDNFNYSRGLLFGYAISYYHYGLRAKYSFSDKYSVTGFMVNGWNDIYDNNTGKTYGVTFNWNPTKKISIAQGYMAGPETSGTNAHWRHLSDTVVTYSPTSRLTTILNFDYGRGDRVMGIPSPVFWTGIAGYVKYAFNDRYALATRYEYYNDHDGFTTGTAQHLNEFTGTFQRVIAHRLITRLEFRRDISNRPVFTKGTTPVMGQNTVAAGLVYSFDSRETKE